MDKAEHTQLARRVGRMNYEQVRALFYENRALFDAHRAAVAQDIFCPRCKWHIEREYDRCAEVEAMWQTWKSFDALDSRKESAYRAIMTHRKTCPICTTVLREWAYLDECGYTRELHEIEGIYARRMNTLEYKERVQQFEQAHGRKPQNILELETWIHEN